MLQISEERVNKDRGYRFGKSGWYEPFTEHRGKLYRALVAEHGRCIGTMYVDKRVPVSSDPTLPAYAIEAVSCGWVFLKRATYDDSAETFLQETWVTVREGVA